MGWFKVDDQLAFHAKVVMAGNSAMGLWLRAGSWSAAHLTDGFVPSHMALAMANVANGMANDMATPCDVDALVMAGLWHEAEGGYQFHDWSEFQPSAAEEKARRDEIKAKRSAAGKLGAAARWQEGKPDGKTMANASQADGKPMAPTRPDPTRPKESVPASRRKPERPLPADWLPNESHKAYANENTINLDFQADRFRNHAQANDRRARDWDAAFRNWLLKAEKTTTTKNALWDS